MEPEQMRVAVQAAIERRIATQEAKGNASLAKKWAIELRHLTHDSSLKAMAIVGFDPARLDNLAIYAATKARKALAHLVGVGKVDPYTEVLVRNALAVAPDGHVANGTMTASLSISRKTTLALPVRRAGAEGTASTQACSTRAALVALGAGVAIGRAFQLDINHPVIAAIAGGAAQEG